MKNFITLAIALLPAIVFAQEPELNPPISSPGLTIKSDLVEVTKIDKVLNRTTTTFNGIEMGDVDKVVSQKERKSKAILITTTEAAVITAFPFSEDVPLPSVSKFEYEASMYLVSGSPGRYVVLANTGTKSAVSVIVIPAAGGDADPTDPVPPEDDGPDVSQLALLSADLANRIDDQSTREALALSLGAIDFSSVDDFLGATALAQASIKAVLAQRTGESRFKDWLNGWRRPIQLELEAMKIDSKPEYIKAISHVVEGLKAAPSNSVSKVRTLNFDVGPVVASSQPSPFADWRRRPTSFTEKLRLRNTPELIPSWRKVCTPAGCKWVLEYVELAR